MPIMLIKNKSTKMIQWESVKILFMNKRKLINLVQIKEATLKTKKIKKKNWFKKGLHRIVEQNQFRDLQLLRLWNRKKKIFKLMQKVIEKALEKCLNIYKSFRKIKKSSWNKNKLMMKLKNVQQELVKCQKKKD